MQSICQILQISEKELLTSAEDVEGRRAEQLARKYLRLIHNYRLIQFLLYGLTALSCFVANLAVQHTLDWFWIVLTAEAMAASLTLLPSYCDERWRGLGCLGSFTGSLLFLLAACCLYSGGTWFFVAAAWVLFAMGLLFLPYTLRRLPLPRPWAERKFSLYVGLETALVVAALGVNCLHDGGDWFFVAAAGALLGIWLVFGWAVLRRLPLSGRRLLAYVAVGTGLLLLLLGAACLYGGGTWFFSAALWSVFGIAVVFLPLTIGQIPWPAVLLKQKALLYFSVISLLLLLGLALDGWGQWFPLPALPVALVCLSLPWLCASAPASWPPACGPTSRPGCWIRLYWPAALSPTIPIL